MSGVCVHVHVQGIEYQLRAAVVHEGQSTSSGHFYTLVWSDDGRCIHCDDQRITELSVEEAAQSLHVGKLFVIVSATCTSIVIFIDNRLPCSTMISHCFKLMFGCSSLLMSVLVI